MPERPLPKTAVSRSIKKPSIPPNSMIGRLMAVLGSGLFGNGLSGMIPSTIREKKTRNKKFAMDSNVNRKSPKVELVEEGVRAPVPQPWRRPCSELYTYLCNIGIYAYAFVLCTSLQRFGGRWEQQIPFNEV